MIKTTFNKISELFGTVFKTTGTVRINGKTYTGNSIIVESDGTVTVDGKTSRLEIIGNITVTVEGECDKVCAASGDIEVRGNVGSVSAVSGDVIVHGDVYGSVSTVSGDVTTSYY